MNLMTYLRECAGVLAVGCALCLLAGCMTSNGKTGAKVQPKVESKITAAPAAKAVAAPQAVPAPKPQVPASVDSPKVPQAPAATPKVSSTTAREIKVALLSEAESAEFKALVRRRSEIQQDWASMERYRREKTTEAAALEQTLQNQYGMDARRQYRFNPKNRTLYLVWPVADGRPKLLPHRRFPTKSEEEQFRKIRAAEAEAKKQAEAFKSYMAGKVAEAEQVAAMLQTKFGVDAAKQYRYDDARRELWEILPPLPGLDGEAEKKVEKKDVAPQSPAPAAPHPVMGGDQGVRW